MVQNIAGRFFGLVTKHAYDRQTDGRTDGRNYDSQDRASIASRGKNDVKRTREYRVRNVFMWFRVVHSCSVFVH